MQKFIEIDIVNSKKFYKKRLFFDFFTESVTAFSFTYLKENGIFYNLLQFLDGVVLCQIRFFSLIPKFYFFIHEDIKILSIIDQKIDKIKKSSKDVELLKVNQIIYI